MKMKILISLFVFVISIDVYSHEGHTHERYSKEQIIQIAMSAGPENVSGDATIISHDGTRAIMRYDCGVTAHILRSC